MQALLVSTARTTLSSQAAAVVVMRLVAVAALVEF
jgi:hypothetical protein